MRRCSFNTFEDLRQSIRRTEKVPPFHLVEYRSNYDSSTMVEPTQEAAETVHSGKWTIWRLIQSAFFVFCAAGFCFQSTEFLNHFYSYPTTVNVELQKLDKLMVPTFTVCSNTIVTRKKFCKKYPKRCKKPENLKLFCETYPYLCQNNKTSEVVMPLDYYRNLTYNDTFELGQNYDELFTRVIGFSSKPARTVIMNLFDGETTSRKCFVDNAYFEYDEEPQYLKLAEIDSRNRYTVVGILQFRVERDEMFPPVFQPQRGVLFSIQLPHDAIYPFYWGKLLKPGKDYVFHISLEEERFLKYPYHTDCINYEEWWRSTNKTVPRSQDMCFEQCEVDYSLACYGCYFNISVVEKMEDLCEANPEFVPVCEKAELSKERDICISKCKIECVKVKYAYSIEEKPRYISRYSKLAIENTSDLIDVYVFVDKPYVLVLSHTPKYMDVELFSYIGGFIGCWLGISMWSVVYNISSIFSKIIKYTK